MGSLGRWRSRTARATQDAFRRELWEELGLELSEPLADHVWERTHVFPMSSWDGQTERFYLIRVPTFEIAPALDAAALRQEGVVELRWWSPDDVRAAEGVVFAPRRLHEHLCRLLSDGPPSSPLDVGI